MKRETTVQFRERRLALGYTQRRLGKALGLSLRQIQYLEAGTHEVKPHHLLALEALEERECNSLKA